MSLILRSLLVALVLMFGAQLAQAETASPFGTSAPSSDTAVLGEAPAAQPSLLRRVGGAVVMLQSRVNRAINAQLMEIKAGDKP